MIGSQGNGESLVQTQMQIPPDIQTMTMTTGIIMDIQTEVRQGEWLYDVLKEQKTGGSGYLENLTVGVVIDTDDTRVSENDLIDLIANSRRNFPGGCRPESINYTRADQWGRRNRRVGRFFLQTSRMNRARE